MNWKEERARREREASIASERELCRRLTRVVELEPPVEQPLCVGCVFEVFCGIVSSDLKQQRSIPLKLRRNASREQLEERLGSKFCVALSKDLASVGEWCDPQVLRHLPKGKVGPVLVLGAHLTPKMTTKETLLALHGDRSSRVSFLLKPLLDLIVMQPLKPVVLNVSSREMREKYADEGRVTVKIEYWADVHSGKVMQVEAFFGQSTFPPWASSSSLPGADGKGVLEFERMFSYLQVLQKPNVVEIGVTYADDCVVASDPFESSQLHTYLNCVCFTSMIARPGDMVKTEKGWVRVAAVVEVRSIRQHAEPSYHIAKDICVTGGHPIWIGGGGGWSRAEDVLIESSCVVERGDVVYCIELEDRTAHKIFLDDDDDTTAAAALGFSDHPVWGNQYWSVTLPLLMEGRFENAKRVFH